MREGAMLAVMADSGLITAIGDPSANTQALRCQEGPASHPGDKRTRLEGPVVCGRTGSGTDKVYQRTGGKSTAVCP
ncbi:hypothetical protein NXV03_13590 [Phocaeicola vulgatus]|nr:hypothetical protein [Phocaeicola vulgatus]